MNFISNMGNALKRNAPAVLTALGISGVASTAILAARGGQKAGAHLSELSALTPREKFEETWRFYLPAFGVASITVLCIVGAQTLNARRQAVLLSIATLSESALSDYKGKVTELYGEKRDNELSNAIAQDKIRDLQLPPLVVGDGQVWCFDTITARPFLSSMEILRKAENEINHQTMHDWNASLNEFFDKVGLSRASIGEEIGWNSDHLLELQITSVIHEGKPMLAVDYRPLPRVDFQKVF